MSTSVKTATNLHSTTLAHHFGTQHLSGFRRPNKQRDSHPYDAKDDDSPEKLWDSTKGKKGQDNRRGNDSNKEMGSWRGCIESKRVTRE
jgi:hypothetical protein